MIVEMSWLAQASASLFVKRGALLVWVLMVLLSTVEGSLAGLSIHLAGDSTMAAKSDKVRPETGWGEKIGGFFRKEVDFKNEAVNGRSVLSFRTEGLWDELLKGVQPGDYVFVQFGHNDQKKGVEVSYSAPDLFRKRLLEFVDDVRGRGGVPVLITPVSRRSFGEDGILKDTLGEYAVQTRSAAAEAKVLLIDLSERSREKLQAAGPEESKRWYLHFQPGQHPNYPKGVSDDTHFSADGAEMVAALVVSEIERIDPNGLGRYLEKNQ